MGLLPNPIFVAERCRRYRNAGVLGRHVLTTVRPAKLAASDVGGGWMLVTGNEGGNTLLIGARASLVKEVKMLEWHRLVDGEYRVKNNKRKTVKASAYSRVMLASACSRVMLAESHIFLTCHMHHHTAKKAKDFADGFDRCWNTVEGILQRHAVDFIAGDFNMSFWQVCPQLRIQYPATTVLTWYGWKTAAGGAYTSAWKAYCEDSEVGETAPVVAGIVLQSRHAASHRSDSCGILSFRKPEHQSSERCPTMPSRTPMPSWANGWLAKALPLIASWGKGMR
jgi:hypothetical protein